MPNYEYDRDAAIEWARMMVSLPSDQWVLLDTETTGLDINTSEIIQIGLLAPDGSEVMSQLVRPRGIIPEDAFAIHGIGNAEVLDKPTFDQVFTEFLCAIQNKIVVIYNAEYDWNLIRAHCKRYGLTFPEAQLVSCAMLKYSAFVGDWNQRRRSYRYKSLPAAENAKAHDALGDCVSTLALIHKMAETAKSNETVAPVPVVATPVVAAETGHDAELWEL